MQTEIKKEVLAILNKIIDILMKKDIRDVIELRNLSDSTIENASIFQDQDSISIGVLVYALAKVIERDFQNQNIYKKVFDKILEARNSLRKDDVDNYRLCIKEIFSMINKVDSRLKMFIELVLNKARVQRGSKLFAQGISMARVADMMNISRWELMSYVGKTRIIDTEYQGIAIIERIKFTRGLFQ